MNKCRLLTPIILAVLASCSPKESAENTQAYSIELSYELDTIMVDAGDHFFYVQNNLGISDIDAKNNLLYNFNTDDFSMEVIDLEQRKLKAIIPYEKEGPNGIGGSFIFNVMHLDDGSTIFFDYLSLSHIDSTGQKIDSYKFNQGSFSGDSMAANEEIENYSLVSEDGKTFYGFYGEQSFEGKTAGIATINLEKNSLKLFPTNFLDFTYDFGISLEMDGNGVAQFPERNYLHSHDGKVLITSTAKNEIWIYDPKTDSLTSKIYESQITSNNKKGNFPSRASGNEEWTAAILEKRKEVTFGGLLYDPDENIFWRLSKEMDRMTASDSVIYKTVLTAFDEDLNQLGEVKLPNEYNSYLKPFMVEGQLWEFLNVEDEIAFVRLKPSYGKD